MGWKLTSDPVLSAGGRGVEQKTGRFRIDVLVGVRVSHLPDGRGPPRPRTPNAACRETKKRRTIDRMSTHARWIGYVGILLLLACAPARAETAPPQPQPAPGTETLVRAAGQRIAGKLRGDAARGFTFESAAQAQSLALEPGSMLIFDGPEPDPTAGFASFRVELGLDQRISGRLSTVDARTVRLVDSSTGGPVTVARPGVLAVIQRPGEVLVLQDGFETIDGTRWTEMGDPDLVQQPHATGMQSLQIPAGGTALGCTLREPVGSGRLDVAFHDDGALVDGQQWFVDLIFRGPAGSETVRAVLGWAEESLTVESPSGPALAVQRLARKPGWHRLSLRFSPAQTEVAVDGNDLAHGKGPSGPLVEIRLASQPSGKIPAPEKLAGHFDDLRLVRFTEPIGGLEIDTGQDEVRLAGGDQLFGALAAADGERMSLKVDEKLVTLPWSEVSGIYFRRQPRQSAAVEGLLVRLEWRAAAGGDPIDLDAIEGALTAVSSTALTLATPYAGTLVLPRDRRRTMRIQGSGRRIVIDPTAHHLGDNISMTPPLIDPPQPEGGVLERTVELAEVPTQPAALVLDVVQVVGEANGLQFAALVQKGELRTNVSINGQPVDYLNRHITSKNDTPERIRLPIPPGRLRPGRNLIRFQQVGIANDPSFLDDLGLLGIALEFGGDRPARAPAQGERAQPQPQPQP
jgi:hypothetical protein